ncbi:substrate-binding periplasmic protein [Leeia sp.]|uniref:substrate-binding periplasmic protein n=1 Tax=Leeia sp. TaxID=2884678 RepID=UPI0035AEE081
MRTVLLVACLLFSAIHAWAGETLKIAAGLWLEPYVIQGKPPRGMELDIVREALQHAGFQVTFILQPFHRSKLLFTTGEVDGVMTIQESFPEAKAAYLSERYIAYRNQAISLQTRQLQIYSMADLQGFSVEAFQQAQFALGEEFAAVVRKHPSYSETADQRTQVLKLLAGRTDVAVMDERIFRYQQARLQKQPPVNVPPYLLRGTVEMHNLFPATWYRIAFRKPALRDAFDRGLAFLRTSHRYQQIVDQYLQ